LKPLLSACCQEAPIRFGADYFAKQRARLGQLLQQRRRFLAKGKNDGCLVFCSD